MMHPSDSPVSLPPQLLSALIKTSNTVLSVAAAVRWWSYSTIRTFEIEVYSSHAAQNKQDELISETLHSRLAGE